jgi:hypothetical protein
MGETRQASGVAIRACQPGDEQIILDLLKNSFRSLEYISRVKAEISGPYFNREGIPYRREEWFSSRMRRSKKFSSRKVA